MIIDKARFFSHVKFVGLFAVFDNASKRKGHKHAPSCLLLELKASIIIPVTNPDGSVKNKTINVPSNARVSGSCGAQMQTITLVWNNTHDSGKLVKTAQLTMAFSKVIHKYIFGFF